MSDIGLVFDCETLGLNERAVVLTLACVPFSFELNHTFEDLVLGGFYVKFDVKEQIKVYHRTLTKGTVDWWKEQPPEARREAIERRDDDCSIIDGCLALRDFIKSSGYDYKTSFVWSRGNAFDFPKIESLFEDAKMSCPFNTWKVRDIRTYIDFLTGSIDGYGAFKDLKIKNFVKHNSLHDAAMDALRMIEIYRSLSD